MYDILLTRVAMGVSAGAVGLGLADLNFSIGVGPDGFSVKKMILVFSLGIMSLFYGNIIYQVTVLVRSTAR
jgi:cellulose synthase (UDP-forming)